MYVSSQLRAQGSTGNACHMQFATRAAWSIPVITASLRTVELLLLLAGMTAAAWLDHPPPMAKAGSQAAIMLATFAISEVLRIGSASTLSNFKSLSGHSGIFAGAVAIGWVLTLGGLLLQGVPAGAAAVWSLALSAALMGALLVSRLLAAALVAWLGVSGRLANKVAILGSAVGATAIATRFLKEDPTLVKLVGHYSVEAPSASGVGAGSAFDVRLGRGDLEMLLMDCRLGGIDSIVIVAPPPDAAPLATLNAALRGFAVDVYMLPGDFELAGTAARPAVLGQQPMLLVHERPLKDWRGLAKTVFDRLCALLILLMIAPVLSLTALMIKLDSPGPVLFRQLRVGYNNQLFRIFKFRTMHANLSDRLATTQTTRGDIRVTRVGRVLRRLSIDELPQLLNVLLGEMSLVGPRPHAPGTSAAGQRVDRLIDNYGRRHLVKPGITGLAQVRGYRGVMTTAEQVSRRVQCDLEYIRRQSLWLDVKIMVMTLAREVGGGRAF